MNSPRRPAGERGTGGAPLGDGPERRTQARKQRVREEEAPVRLDLSLCKACGICIDLCPENVFDATEMGEAVVARPGDCSLCLLCELHCPDFAIEVTRRTRKKSADAVAEEAHEAHAGRVYAALATKPKRDEAAEVTGDDEPCAHKHEEH
jgi:2-oxoglutarate ferredoxin oxidoreductase subunit delta